MKNADGAFITAPDAAFSRRVLIVLGLSAALVVSLAAVLYFIDVLLLAFSGILLAVFLRGVV